MDLDFRIVNFEVSDEDHYGTGTIVLANNIHELEVSKTPHGLVVNFFNSNGEGSCWWEEDKVWIDDGSLEDRTSAPEEWDEAYWNIVSTAETKINELMNVRL